MKVAGELHHASLLELARALHERELSAVEAARAQLDRIDRLNESLGAYYAVFPEEALAAAAEADAEIARGELRGPLHGVPIAFKDIYGLGPTTAGSALLRDHRARDEAAVVTRMREQGAVILGKLATHEFALSAATLNDAFPPARNPWNRDLTPGGSSTGAGTALAAGLAYGAFGTDTGGSVRIPAAHCAVVGFKPTFGLLSRRGIIPLAWSLDHAGPMARTVADAAALFLGAQGYDPEDPGSSPAQVSFALEELEAGLGGVRLGVPRDYFEPGCDPQVREAFEAALGRLRELGAVVVDVELGVSFEEVAATGYLVTLAEAAAYHAPDIRARPKLYGREFRLLLKTGMALPAQAYVDAQRARRAIAGRVAAAFDSCDLLVNPTLGMLADPLPAEPRPIHRRISETPARVLTWLANLYGGPAVSVPCGFNREGLPMGIQFAGRAYDDLAVLRAAFAYESASPWKDRHPAI